MSLMYIVCTLYIARHASNFKREHNFFDPVQATASEAEKTPDSTKRGITVYIIIIHMIRHYIILRTDDNT